jgi:hypothetical protein
MAATNLSLDGLSLSDEGLTLNLESDSTNVQILEHCLIGRVLTDKQIRFSYLKERLSHVWKPGKKSLFYNLMKVDICSNLTTGWMLRKLFMKVPGCLITLTLLSSVLRQVLSLLAWS